MKGFPRCFSLSLGWAEAEKAFYRILFFIPAPSTEVIFGAFSLPTVCEQASDLEMGQQ